MQCDWYCTQIHPITCSRQHCDRDHTLNPSHVFLAHPQNDNGMRCTCTEGYFFHCLNCSETHFFWRTNVVTRYRAIHTVWIRSSGWHWLPVLVYIVMVMNRSGVQPQLDWGYTGWLPQYYDRIMLFAVCSAIDIAHKCTQLFAVVSTAIEITP